MIKKRHFILRASLTLEGRALTLLQEVKAIDDYNCPRVLQTIESKSGTSVTDI